MRTSLTSGSLFNGLAIIGTGAAVMLPDQRWIGALIIGVGILALIFDVRFERGHVEIGSPRTFGKRFRAMSAQIIMLAGALLFVVGAILYFWPARAPVKTAVAPSGMIFSRGDRYQFTCSVPAPSEDNPKTFPERFEAWKKSLQILGEAVGVEATVTTIEGGVRLELEPITEEMKRKLIMIGLPPGVTKAIFEIRRVSPENVIVTIDANYPYLLRQLFSIFTPDPASKETLEMARQIERMLHFPEGVCRLL